jgi:hypothetical protein
MTEAHPPVPAIVSAADDAAPERLAREAALELSVAVEGRARLHEPGQRERYRELLGGAIELASRALDAAEEERSSAGASASDGAYERLLAIVTSARFTLVTACAAKAEDALHGVGQLSLSAQRAPTLEACDDGWQRVEEVALGAEAASRMARACALELERDAPGSAAARKASAAARQADAAAGAARRIIDERNHAYTFHADAAFSFGEGWYLAAAAVLAGVSIQIERAKDGTTQAEQFLRDAGLADRLTAYRSRPRAMKQTTELVARAFRADPAAAQAQLRAAFLGKDPIPSAVVAWIDSRLRPAEFAEKKVLLWIREGVHHATRNTRFDELAELTTRVQRAGLVPVLIGDALRGEVPEGAVDMTLFWQDPIFRQADMRRVQLQFFEHLRQRHGTLGQLGVTTAGMDGPALMGLPTLYLTDAPNVRMGEWVGAVPGYQEVVRESGYLERVARTLSDWRATA